MGKEHLQNGHSSASEKSVMDSVLRARRSARGLDALVVASNGEKLQSDSLVLEVHAVLVKNRVSDVRLEFRDTTNVFQDSLVQNGDGQGVHPYLVVKRD